jgi:hypothetical protein
MINRRTVEALEEALEKIRESVEEYDVALAHVEIRLRIASRIGVVEDEVIVRTPIDGRRKP